MSKSGFAKIGNVDHSKIIMKKLRIMDHVFCYKGIDLNNAKIEYYFDKIQYVEYENGKKKEDEYSPIIYFSISADDQNNKIHSFDFAINMDVDMLNKMSDKPTNINKYIIQGETYFWDPYEDSEVPEFFDLEEDIYHFTPSYMVQKLDDKKFAFKIQYQNLFIWFHIDFCEN